VPHAYEAGEESECSGELVDHEGVFGGELVLSGTDVGGEGGLNGSNLRVDFFLCLADSLVNTLLGRIQNLPNLQLGILHLPLQLLLTLIPLPLQRRQPLQNIGIAHGVFEPPDDFIVSCHGGIQLVEIPGGRRRDLCEVGGVRGESGNLGGEGGDFELHAVELVVRQQRGE